MHNHVTISPRRVLHDEIASAIRTMIAQGQLRPGSRVPEQELCARFGVSRTPLREALKVLSAEGLVRLMPNRGAVVERLTRKAVEDMILVLGVFESLAAELACLRIDDDRISHIEALHERMMEHFRRGEGEPYVELNRAFHTAIFQAADNCALTSLHAIVHRRLCVLLALAPKPPLRWEEAVADHERMLNALRARDVKAFAHIAREHLRHRNDMANAAIAKQEQRTGERKREGEALGSGR